MAAQVVAPRTRRGQATAPVTFTYRLDEPLTADAVLAAARGDDPPSAAGVLVAELNADRTVTTDHLSLKSWLKANISTVVSAVTTVIGRVVDQRANPPDCPTPRPEWTTQEPDLLDDINGPMLVCVGGDDRNPDAAVVEIVNNRGGIILVIAPVTRDMVAGQNPFVIQSRMTPLGAAYGAALGEVALELVACVVSRLQEIFELLEADVPKAARHRMSGDITRVAANAKSKGAPLLPSARPRPSSRTSSRRCGSATPPGRCGCGRCPAASRRFPLGPVASWVT
ncbi:MAG: hypothetical protein JWR45_1623 [Blastococcus sp.]|jgi:hypothetical protein|nr:hypothetical protein [Blastococcus sp.]